jgi:23S rRNA (cytidine1920-2'-O)/16S rRNA (cytidine1409-2'-O)-methyltransferase
MRRRLDAELVRRHLVPTPEEALAAIAARSVLVSGSPASSPATLVGDGEPIAIRARRRFVSRGGEKLDAALERFGVAVAGRTALDAGASTGGFTDCLLQRGAERVVAVDVGYGLLDWRLRGDPRVVLLERTNIKDVQLSSLAVRPEVVVADLAFISLGSVVPDLASLASAPADAVLLVKPQFEAPRAAVPSGGVVTDPEVWRRAVGDVAEACLAAGWTPRAVMASPMLGAAGNAEFLLHADDAAPGENRGPDVPGLDQALAEAARRARGPR